MYISLQQKHHTIVDLSRIEKSVKEELTKKRKKETLCLYPLDYLAPYPVELLLNQEDLIQKNEALLTRLSDFSKSLPPNDDICLLLGGIRENKDKKTLKRVIYKFIQGREVETLAFDENQIEEINIFHKKIILLKEDSYKSLVTPLDKAQKRKDTDLLILISLAPYSLHKEEQDQNRALSLSKEFKAPLLQVNTIKLEENKIYEGGSFLQNENKLLLKLKNFKEDEAEINLSDLLETLPIKEIKEEREEKGVKELSDQKCDELINAITFTLREYTHQNNFKRYTIALSGGLDSSIVLTLLRLSISKEEEIEAIYMPSTFSSSESYELSFNLCKSLGVHLTTMPIKFLHSAVKNLFSQTFQEIKIEGLTDENIQARLRGMLLYTRSNQKNSIVLNTSNKSELLVGYSTQYGDTVGALSIIGDLYKSEIINLAHYLNKKFNGIIPERIITRPPSAELRTDQKDEDSLPPYHELDQILDLILGGTKTKQEIVEQGFKEAVVQKVISLYLSSEYKRRQFCPIINLREKSLLFENKIPMNSSNYLYQDF